MKRFYQFLFYKLYRFIKAQEQTVSLNLGFLSYCTIFEGLHLALFAIPLKYFGNNLDLNIKLFAILFFIIGFLFNYLYFIRNKRIERINLFFQENNRIVLKDNIMFFSYIILLFLVIFSQIYLLKLIE
jgi:hypothetical protein